MLVPFCGLDLYETLVLDLSSPKNTNVLIHIKLIISYGGI